MEGVSLNWEMDFICVCMGVYKFFVVLVGVNLGLYNFVIHGSHSQEIHLVIPPPTPNFLGSAVHLLPVIAPASISGASKTYFI